MAVLKNEEFWQRVGNQLRVVRESKNLTMSVALEIRDKYKVKLDKSYLSRMERGLTEIPTRTLLAFADYYDISVGQLIDPGLYKIEQRELEILLKNNKFVENFNLLAEKLDSGAKALDHVNQILSRGLKLLEDRDDTRNRKLKEAGIPEGAINQSDARVPTAKASARTRSKKNAGNSSSRKGR